LEIENGVFVIKKPVALWKEVDLLFSMKSRYTIGNTEWIFEGFGRAPYKPTIGNSSSLVVRGLPIYAVMKGTAIILDS